MGTRDLASLSFSAIAPGGLAVVTGGASGVGLAAARAFAAAGMTAARSSGKPPAAWTPEQDVKRIAWAAGDMIENRPALSRWHPDWRDAFARHMVD